MTETDDLEPLMRAVIEYGRRCRVAASTNPELMPYKQDVAPAREAVRRVAARYGAWRVEAALDDCGLSSPTLVEAARKAYEEAEG